MTPNVRCTSLYPEIEIQKYKAEYKAFDSDITLSRCEDELLKLLREPGWARRPQEANLDSERKKPFNIIPSKDDFESELSRLKSSLARRRPVLRSTPMKFTPVRAFTRSRNADSILSENQNVGKSDRSHCFPSAWKQGLLKFLVVLLYLFAIHVFVSALCIAISHKSFAQFFKKLGYVARAAVAAITTHRCLHEPETQRLHFITCLQRNKCAPYSSVRPIFVKSVVISWCITLTYWTIKTALMVWYFLEEEVFEYFDEMLYGVHLDSDTMPVGLAAFLAILDWTLSNATALLSGIHLTELIWECYTLQKGVDGVSATVQNLVNRLGLIKPSEIEEVQVVYMALREQLRSVERKYSLPIFLWISEIVVNIICCIRGISKFLSSSVYDVADESVEVVYYVIIFSVLCYELSEIDHRGKALERRVGEMAAYVTGENWELCNQLIMLDLTLSSQRFALTGGKFFFVDKTVSLTIVAVVIAYAIILLELANKV